MRRWLHRPRFVVGVAANALYLALYFLWPSPGVVVVTPTWRDDRAWEPPPFVKFPPREGRAQAKSYYASAANQTSVYTNDDLTLVNWREWRVLLYPLFVVAGDEVTAPKMVHLRFTSFSGSPAFAPGSSLSLFEFNHAAPFYNGSLSYSLTTNDMGGSVESLECSVPYGAFLKMLMNERPRFKVGGHEFTLSRGQTEALRDMQRCVETRGCP